MEFNENVLYHCRWQVALNALTCRLLLGAHQDWTAILPFDTQIVILQDYFFKK